MVSFRYVSSVCLSKRDLRLRDEGAKVLNGCFARSLLRFYLTNTAKTNCFLSGCCYKRADLNFSLEIYHERRGRYCNLYSSSSAV